MTTLETRIKKLEGRQAVAVLFVAVMNAEGKIQWNGKAFDDVSLELELERLKLRKPLIFLDD